MPENIKYISKIHVGEEYYYIKSSIDEIAVDSTPVFKDGNGKYWNLSKTLDGAVTLKEYEYNAPDAFFYQNSLPSLHYEIDNEEVISYISYTSSINSDGNAIITSDIDEITKTSIECTFTGYIKHMNTDYPTFPELSDLNLDNNLDEFSIPITVNNDSITIKSIVYPGLNNIPGTNDKESVTLSVKIYTNKFKKYAYVLSTNPDDIKSKSTLDGFAFDISHGIQMDGYNDTLNIISNLSTQEIHIPSNVNNVYLYIISADNKDGHMFIMKADHNSVDGATTPSGAIKVGTVQAYSTGKIYHIYRSLDKFNANDTVSFKAN